MSRSTHVLSVVPRIHRAAHRIAVYLAQDVKLDVSQAEAHVLTHLASYGESTIGQIHIAFGHRRSTLTSILDRMVKRGFITRHSSEADRRTFIVSLTVKGQTAARSALKALEDFERDLASRVTPGDLKGFLKVVEAIADEKRRRAR